MKIIALLCLLALPAFGQTYFNYKLTNWDNLNSDAQVVFDVPSNSVFTAVAVTASNAAGLESQYPESTNWIQLLYSDSGVAFSGPSPKVLGPAKIRFSGMGENSRNDIAVLLGKFETVNTTPALAGYGVQPNGKTATVSLETSADLQTWQTATNGTYPATNAAAFYRLKMDVE